MENQFERTELLLGKDAIQKLKNAHVAVFGVGGVGGFVVEALVRSGVGEIDIIDINPNVKINAFETFFLPDTADMFDFSKYDYVVDAIDTVKGKIEIILRAEKAGVKIISSMGAGNKLDPTLFEVSDIYKTSVCPLARVMRRELKARGIKKLKVVYSKEEAIKIPSPDGEKPVPGSIAFVPSVAGLIIAGEIIKDLVKEE